MQIYKGDRRPPHLLPLLAPPQAGQVLTRYPPSVKIIQNSRLVLE